jgi:hypothetical protein
MDVLPELPAEQNIGGQTDPGKQWGFLSSGKGVVAAMGAKRTVNQVYGDKVEEYTLIEVYIRGSAKPTMVL